MSALLAALLTLLAALLTLLSALLTLLPTLPALLLTLLAGSIAAALDRLALALGLDATGHQRFAGGQVVAASSRSATVHVDGAALLDGSTVATTVDGSAAAGVADRLRFTHRLRCAASRTMVAAAREEPTAAAAVMTVLTAGAALTDAVMAVVATVAAAAIEQAAEQAATATVMAVVSLLDSAARIRHITARVEATTAVARFCCFGHGQ